MKHCVWGGGGGEGGVLVNWHSEHAHKGQAKGREHGMKSFPWWKNRSVW